MAFLERPSEGRACLIASEGVPFLDAAPVRMVAVGARAVSEPVSLEATDVVLVPDAPLAELRVVDVDGDGDDEVLVRPRVLTGDMLPPRGTRWRETVWVSDCSGVARLVVDVSTPMTVPSAVIDSVHPVGGGGSALAIVTVMIAPNPFAYVVTRDLAARVTPCTDLSCLPPLLDGDSTINAAQPAAWERPDGTLALVHMAAHLSGHLQSEWYASRRDCEALEGGYSCSDASDWGPLTKALATGFLAPSGDAFLRLSRPDLEYEDGAAESWSTPSDHVARALPGRFLPGWARFEQGRWRFGGVVLGGEWDHKPVVMEQAAGATRVVSTSRIPGWSAERTGVVESNRARDRSLIVATDSERGAIAAFPAE